jgi:CheY-like chemotaxis protein
MFKQILLIDDDYVDNLLNKQILDRMYLAEEVVTCISGLEALVRVRESWPELMLLDINMPGMSGLEFLEELNLLELENEPAEHVVVLLTSSNHPDDLTKAAELKANYYLVKPLTEEKIKKMLQRCFVDKRPKAGRANGGETSGK